MGERRTRVGKLEQGKGGEEVRRSRKTGKGGACYKATTKKESNEKESVGRFRRICKHRKGGADYKSCIKQNRDDKDRDQRFSRIGKHRNGGADYKSCIKQNRDDNRSGLGRLRIVHQAEK